LFYKFFTTRKLEKSAQKIWHLESEIINDNEVIIAINAKINGNSNLL